MAAFGRSFLQRSHGINGFQPMILQDHPADFADETERDSLPLREMLRLAGGACLDCSDRYSAVEAVYSIALGFRNAPRCLRCVAVRTDSVAA